MRADRRRSGRGRRAALALLLTLQAACFGETEIVQRGGGSSDAATGGAGGAGGADGASGGGGGGPALPEDRCDVDVDLDSLDGWEAGGDRWKVEDGRVAVAAGGASGLLLRGREETCSDVEASVTFFAAPGAYPLLVARVGAGGGWYGVGYDGRYGAAVLLTGNGAETGETVAPIDFVDLDPGRPYRLSLRVVDDALVGTLSEGEGRPLAVLHGPAPARPGPGRVGLLEVAGGAVRFERFRAAPVARAGGALRAESARVVAPDTLVVTTAPRGGDPLRVDHVPGGLSLRAGGADVAVTDVAPRPGTTGELLVTADAFLRGGDDVVVAHDGGDAIARGDDPLPAFTASAGNLLWSDVAFSPYSEDFDVEGLAAGWVADAPEAFAAGRGGLTVTPQGRYGEKAWLRRPTAEAHVDATATADFTFDARPRREAERTTAFVALRSRSAVNGHYQAAFGYGDFDANLAIRVMNRDGFTSDLATAPVDRAAVAPGTPLRLVFSASGPLLWASLYRLGDDGPVLLAALSASHRQVTGPGPVALGARGHGTVRFDRLTVAPAEAPPPRVAAARVPANDPNSIEISVQAASALRGIGPAGFRVFAGEERTVASASRTPDGLALKLEGAPIQAGQRVFVSYDAAAGGVTDSAQPRPRAMPGVERFPVRNEAPAAPVLALAHVRLVTPDTLDLVVTDSGALPVRVDGTDGLTVRVKGRAAALIAARPLAEARDVVRVSFDAEAAPGDAVEVAFSGAAIADAGGQALRPFAGAPAENLLAAPERPTPERDDFERAEGPGNGWEARTPALWGVEGGALRYVAESGLDGRLFRPATVAPARYRAAVKVRVAPYREGFEEPTASLFGSHVGVNPANPEEFFDVRLQLNFATGDVSLVGQFNAPVAGARLEAPVAPDETVRLVLEVNGRAAEGRVEALDGRVLAAVRYFLPMDAPAGRLGLAGGGAGVVFFDDWAVDAPEARPPWTQALSARLAAATPNDVRVEVGTPSGRVLTGGAGEGWTVRVDEAARRVEGVQVSGRSLLVRFGGTPVSARQRVTVAYDARRGDVHDGSDPVPFPLETLPATAVVNQTAVGADLFVAAAEVVDPWSLDLVLNDAAALPAAPEARAHTSFTVRAGDEDLAVRAVAVLPERDARLRLLLSDPIPAGAAVRVTYAPGEPGARVLDRRGGELQPPLEVAARNGLAAPAAFAPYLDDFDGPGINFGAGWTPEPAESWVRDRGDALFSRQDFREGNSLLRPEGEAREDVRLATRVRVEAPPLSFVAAGVVARVGPEGGYRGWYAGADGLTPVLRVERMGPFGGTLLAQAPVPRLNPNTAYDFDFLVQGAFVRLEVRRGDEVVGLVGAVDPGAPLPPGRVGLVAQGAGTARFSALAVDPPGGVRAGAVALRATVFSYAPDTIALDVAAARRLLFTDGRGFRVTVNGAPRGVAGLALEATRALIRVEGAPLRAEDDVRVAFDPAAGLLVDDSAVPQPLGGFSDLRARSSSPPLLASTTVLGRNVVELTYAAAANGLPLEIEGHGGLQVWIAHADLGPAPVRLGLVDVWLDPLRDGDTLLLATAEAIPRGAQVSIVSAPGPANRLTDANGVDPAPLDLPVTAPAARTQADVDAPAVYEAAWGGEEPSGWRYYGALAGRWTEEDAALLATGSGVINEATSAFAPPAAAVADVKVSVDFRIEDVDAPLGRHAFPRVDVRGFNDDFWVGCFVRNDRALLPAVDGNGQVAFVDDASPALVCAAQDGEAGHDAFDGCRMQFYEGGRVRYDWAERWLDAHRLVVKVRGRRLRAELYNLDQRDAGQPRLVAVTEVPDIGDRPGLGLPGLGAFDSGRVRFANFRVEPLGADDFPALDERWAPSGDCR